MKRILSERNFVAVLFAFALIFFVFAQQDAKKVEKMYMAPGNAVSTLIPDSKNTTENITPAPATELTVVEKPAH